MWAECISPIDERTLARSLHRAPGFAWLDSNRAGTRDGRYSYLSAWPTDEARAELGNDDPFAVLEEIEEREAEGDEDRLSPRQVPAWVGYVAYDAFWSAPPRGVGRFDRGREPVVLFRRYPAWIVVDHDTGQTWVAGDDQRGCHALLANLRAMPTSDEAVPRIGAIRVDDASSHRRAIEKALGYIDEGQVYEVNLARRWSAAFEGEPLSLWEAMREASRVPLGFFWDAGDHAVLGCTMERFLRWDARSKQLVTHPIKGTSRRERTDPKGARRLQADPKERAEHSMIVDLMRNDFGRVAELGTVEVEAPLVVEPFTGLYHLVSTVRCTTRSDAGLRQIVEATFPPGSVTGAPKIRAIEIIEELERHPRGIYCGALGFIDRQGGLSLAVAIRTAIVRGDVVHYWAGGGIVEASDPDREVAETELKARVFLDAVESIQGRSDSVWR